VVNNVGVVIEVLEKNQCEFEHGDVRAVPKPLYRSGMKARDESIHDHVGFTMRRDSSGRVEIASDAAFVPSGSIT
jgi:hypothetical protein